MNEGLALSPQLPLPVLLAMTFCFAPFLVLCLWQAKGTSAAFLLVAVWLRVVSGAFNEITFARIVGGLSINALMSVLTVTIGVMLVPKRHFLSFWVLPIYGLLVVIMISGLVNGSVMPAIEMSFKWGYVVVIVAATFQAMRENGMTRTLTMLMFCYLPIFGFQFVSLLFGIAKTGESDGSASYIGGYFHEAVFSVMALTFATLAYFSRKLGFSARFLLISIGTASIVLANYRTAIIAILPLMLGFFLVSGIGRFMPRQRVIVFAFAMPLAVVFLAALAFSDSVQDRFGDIARLFLNSDEFFKPQSQFTVADGKVLSGRLYIWAGYIEGYMAASDIQLLFGLGPNSWAGVFRAYAHNTVVSFLYELGAFGVAALLAVWASAVWAIIKIRDASVRNQLLLALGGFLILNMATMPHWQVEGNILFGITLATILYEGTKQQGVSA